MKKNIILFLIIFFIIAALFVIIRPARIENNLANGVFSSVFSKNTAKKLSLRYSTEINVIIESSDKEKLNESKAEFLKKFDQDVFKIRNIDPSIFLDDYVLYSKNLLSDSAFRLLKSQDYHGITIDAYSRLFDTSGVTTVSLKNDPFMLFSDYQKSIKTEKDIVNYEGKFYDTINLDIIKDKSITPKVLNEKIKELIDLQESLSTEDSKVYLTGIPISSYYENLKSGIEVKLIYLFSIAFIFGICYFYFKNPRILILIYTTMALGLLAGYFACDLLFYNVHFFTFVFSGSLLCYSFGYLIHFLLDKGNLKVLKNTAFVFSALEFSFILLLFSGIEFLKQISVFMFFGLGAIYTISAISFKYLNFKIVPRNFSFCIRNKYKKALILFIIILISFGMYFAKFNDDISQVYYPTDKLMQIQKLYRNISGDEVKTSFIIVEGKDLQDILEKEEEITQQFKNIKYQSLSKFVPSIKRQKENFKLRQNLYKNYLKTYATFLSSVEAQSLIDDVEPTNFLITDNEEFLSKFLIDKNTSMIILYNFDNPNLIKEKKYKYVNLQNDLSSKISNVRKDFEYALIPAFIILFVILTSKYKAKKAFRIITPPVLATTFTLGFLTILRQELNIFHIAALFLIIAMSIEYTIFKINFRNYNQDIVLLSYISSTFGSLLLALTTFKPVSSIGLTLFIGLTVSYLMSITFGNKKELLYAENNISN